MGHQKEPLEETQGDTFEKTIRFTDSNDDPIDISTWTIYVTVKKSYSDADSEAVLSQDVTSHDVPTNGETSFSFPPSETEGLRGMHFYEIKYEEGDGTVETLLSRRIEFHPAVRNSL